jgi:hypothetical protein
MAWAIERVFVVVKAYPNPAHKGTEVSCTAGITRDGRWIRLHPVPFRFLDQNKQFPKYAWIDASVQKSSDFRSESFNINPDSIKIINEIKSWEARWDLIQPLQRHCLCCIKQEQKEQGNSAPTLGIIKPQIKRLHWKPCAPNWTLEERAILEQKSLGFSNEPREILEKVPFDFHYEFRCPENTCRGHDPKCLDWELYQSYRKWRRLYGDTEWQAKLCQKYEDWIINQRDTHFFVGTIKAHPHDWSIVGLYYPPRDPNMNLFKG